MIQRIQTIWFFLAATAAVLTLKLPTYTGSDAHLRPNSDLTGTETFPLLAITLLVAVAALLAVFFFKNRKLQTVFAIVGIVLELLVCVLYYRAAATFTGGTISLFAILHPAIIIFLILGLRGVQRDGKLLRESDRLR